MSRVQSILTYTIPAKQGETCPPPAPIRCGCDDLLLILEDRSLLQTALRGILRTEIKSVAVSNQPVPFVDPVSGRNIPSWKYDYTIEYNDEDLTDTSYRVRKCDVSYNCCYACGQAYTDRQLEGYVQSLGILDTNSIDMVQGGSAQNPVLSANAKVSATVGNRLSIVADGLYVPEVTDSLVDNGDRTFTHTAVDGSVTTFCQGIQQIVTPNGCEGIGPNFAIKAASFNGCTLNLNGAAEHYSIAQKLVSASGAPSVGLPSDVDYFSPSAQIVLTNPSNCRNMQVVLFHEIGVEFETPGIPFRYNWAIQIQTNGGGFFDIAARTSYVPSSSVAIGNRFENTSYRQVVITLAPSQVITIDVRLRWRPVAASGIVHTFLAAIGAIGSTT